jgi:hypothetical protein
MKLEELVNNSFVIWKGKKSDLNRKRFGKVINVTEDSVIIFTNDCKKVTFNKSNELDNKIFELEEIELISKERFQKLTENWIKGLNFFKNRAENQYNKQTSTHQ